MLAFRPKWLIEKDLTLIQGGLRLVRFAGRIVLGEHRYLPRAPALAQLRAEFSIELCLTQVSKRL